MIKLTNLLKEITLTTFGTPKVFMGVNPTGESVELYKLEPFPAIIDQKDISKNSLGFKNALTLVLNEAYGFILRGSLEEFIDNGITIKFLGNFSSPLNKVYIYPDPEGDVAIVDSLDKFSNDHQNEQNWGITEWEEIKSTPTIKEITLKPVSNKITAHFKKDDSRPTGYELYGYVFSKDNPIIKEFLKDYQSKSLFDRKEIEKLLCVIPRTVEGIGLGIHLDAFGWSYTHDVRDELIEFLKKRNIQARGGMHDGNLVVWVPKENVNIVEPN